MKIEVKEKVVRTVESVSVDAGSFCLILHSNLKGDYDGLINNLSFDGCQETLTLDFHSEDFGTVRVLFNPQNVVQKGNARNLTNEFSKLYNGSV